MRISDGCVFGYECKGSFGVNVVLVVEARGTCELCNECEGGFVIDWVSALEARGTTWGRRYRTGGNCNGKGAILGIRYGI